MTTFGDPNRIGICGVLFALWLSACPIGRSITRRQRRP